MLLPDALIIVVKELVQAVNIGAIADAEAIHTSLFLQILIQRAYVGLGP